MNPAGIWGTFLFLVPGIALTALVPALRQRRPGERIGFAYILGVAFVAGGLYGASHVFHAPIHRTSVLVTALLPAAAAIATRPWRAPCAPIGPRSSWKLAALAIGAVVAAGLLSDAVTNPVLDWDGRMIWGAHARIVREERNVDAEVLRSARFFVIHPRYPLLLPLAQVAVEETLGSGDDDRVIRPLYAAFLPAFLLVLYGAARRVSGPTDAAIATIAAALLPALGRELHGGALGQYSDFPLAAFVGSALALLTGPRTRGAGAAAGLLLGAAILTKQEGVPLAAVVILASAAHALPKARRLRPLAAAALVAAGAASLLFHWRAAIVNRQDEDYAAGFAPLLILRGFASRAGALTRLAWREMTDSHWWGWFWWVAPPVALLGASGLLNRRARAYLLFLPGAMAIYLAAYAVTGWDLDILVHTTWNRFLVQTSFAWLLLFACSVRAGLGLRPLGVRAPTR